MKDQTTFNEDGMNDLVEDGEIENVNKNKYTIQ